MEMDDHHHQYGLSDLRQLINGRPSMHFQPIPQVSELFPGHRNLLPQPHHHFEMMQMVGTRQMSDLLPLGLHEIPVESSANAATATVAVTSASTPSSVNGFDGEVGGFGGDAGTGRWPRQETLTLLEIRSRLDPKFKEANQKGPLWDEVSRIMSDEHGYQRSGKKCREKFENLYKYYKKTKEGKAGRQDGKHYRFFRQLEALYGDTSSSVPIPESDHLIGKSFGRFHGNPNSNSSTQEGYHSQKLCDSLSLSNNSSDFHTSCSDDNDLSTAAGVENDSRKRRRSGRSWKVKIKEFIDVQMRKLMERQEAWLDRLTKTLEHKERERMLREEEWRKQEAERIDKEHKFWAKEREWIEARDAALMEALQTLSGRQIKAASPEELMVGEVQNHSENQNENGSEIMNNSGKEDGWGEAEITRLIQVRSSMKSRFDQGGGCPEEILWEEIASKLACLGYEKSGSMCKEKWDEINNFLRKKKSKENSISGPYYSNNESIYNPPGGYCEINGQGGNSPPNSNIGNAASDSCFKYLMGDGENLWENYGLKLNKGENQ